MLINELDVVRMKNGREAAVVHIAIGKDGSVGYGLEWMTEDGDWEIDWFDISAIDEVIWRCPKE